MSWPAVRGVGAVLAPAGHPAVDQAGVAGQAVVGAEPEPLGDPGPEPLDQGVGLLDQAQHRLPALGMLEVDADRPPAPAERRRRPAALPPSRTASARSTRRTSAPMSASIMPGERAGPDPGQLDYPHSAQRTCSAHACLPVHPARLAGPTDLRRRSGRRQVRRARRGPPPRAEAARQRDRVPSRARSRSTAGRVRTPHQNRSWPSTITIGATVVNRWWCFSWNG